MPETVIAGSTPASGRGNQQTILGGIVMKCKDCNYWYDDEDGEYGFTYCHFTPKAFNNLASARGQPFATIPMIGKTIMYHL